VTPSSSAGPPPSPVLSDDERAAAALAALGVSPARLRRLLDGWEPVDAWAALQTGDHPEDGNGALRAAARPELLQTVARRCAARGLFVLLRNGPGYPAALAQDPEAPAVLFGSGRPAALAGGPAVAVVGTRSAGVAGRQVAGVIGEELAAHGVHVVSGLALGIDLAAHLGTLRATGASPVAVLGSPHDAFMTSAQRRVCDAVALRGLVLSEQAPGTMGARWRFASRNRIMAALANLVVVVEAHESGGAWYTVRAARRRGVPVAAVPGSLANPAAAGTNALLAAGASCVRDGADVLALLGLSRTVPPARRPRTAAVHTGADAQAVLGAFGGEPLTADDLARRTGLGFAQVALALEQLAAAGRVRVTGGWWERTPPRLRSAGSQPSATPFS